MKEENTQAEDACRSSQLQEKPMRDRRGRFLKGQSGNPAGRKAGPSCSALRRARDAAEKVALPKLIEAAEAGNMEACRVLLSCGLPRQKPVSLPEPVNLPDTENMADVVRSLLHLVARGEISTSTAAEIASVAATAARVDEVTELRERVETLARILEARGNDEK